jgi:predicted DsbA family dithiol-disulfide isomerase
MKALLEQKFGPDKARYFLDRLKTIAELGAAVGIKYNNLNQVFSSKDTHRLIQWCQETQPEEKCNELLDKLFVGYFEECVDYSKRENLIEAVRSVGLDVVEAEAMLSSDRYEKEIHELDTLVKKKVSEIPYFTIAKGDRESKPITFIGVQVI